jgi:hypothetical protein
MGRPRGRPTKRTPELEEELLRALRLGNSRSTAAAFVGIDDSTLWRWTENFAGFCKRVEAAEATAEVRVVGRLIEAADAGDMQAIKFWLERRRPDSWGPPRVRLEGDITVDLPDLLRRGLMARQDDFTEPTPSTVPLPFVLNANGTTEI